MVRSVVVIHWTPGFASGNSRRLSFEAFERLSERISAMSKCAGGSEVLASHKG